jgi:nucleoside-diphosphate-sugar epimerase
MKTILATGGAGFVGRHACKALSRAGYLPVTLDSLERGHEGGQMGRISSSPLRCSTLQSLNGRMCSDWPLLE